jgi:hypothetical protein
MEFVGNTIDEGSNPVALSTGESMGCADVANEEVVGGTTIDGIPLEGT